MSVIRVNKNKDYSVISNYHLKDKNLSLKAKGLLSVMLSLPEDWNYTVEGLVAISKENETCINSSLKELKEFGYLVVKKLLPNETKTGRYEYIYDVYEMPKQEGEKQDLEFLGVEFLGVENRGQLNTNILNTNKQNTKKYIKYGVYQRIKLTEAEYERLIGEFGKDYIDNLIQQLDEYVESNNNKNKYTNFNLVIRKAIREKWFERTPENKKGYDDSELLEDKWLKEFNERNK